MKHVSSPGRHAKLVLAGLLSLRLLSLLSTVGITKWDYGCLLASCLTYLMLKQQDAVGLALLGIRPGLLHRKSIRHACNSAYFYRDFHITTGLRLSPICQLLD